MNSESFYMTLFSNVINSDTRNIIGNYITPLPPLSLDRKWRVGLAEIRYTNSWYNIRQKCAIDVVDSNKKSYLKDKGFIYPGRYTDPRQVTIEIQRLINLGQDEELVKKLPRLSVHPHSHKVEIEVGLAKDEQLRTDKPTHLYVDMPSELEMLLGLDCGYTDADFDESGSVLMSGRSPLEAQNTYDMTGGIHSLLVYCDIVDQLNSATIKGGQSV